NFFVCDFLGTVNTLELDGKKLYVRPHEITLSTTPGGLEATVTAIRTAGQMVQVALFCNGSPISAAISHADYERLNLKNGQTIYATPTVQREFPPKE
ncbi:MAG: TOBE-like domain-containing protein, partial [Victivallales bacterium]|nr:TOBE-like domain-containing protein [Victivallales bacterium]